MSTVQNTVFSFTSTCLGQQTTTITCMDCIYMHDSNPLPGSPSLLPCQEGPSAGVWVCLGFLTVQREVFFPLSLLLVRGSFSLNDSFSLSYYLKTRAPSTKKSRKVCEKCLANVLSCVGKVLVHCARGISRSATLVLAYLMLREGLTLVEALEAVRRHRNILPNAGFLNQLRQLDALLAQQRNEGLAALPEK